MKKSAKLKDINFVKDIFNCDEVNKIKNKPSVSRSQRVEKIVYNFKLQNELLKNEIAEQIKASKIETLQEIKKLHAPNGILLRHYDSILIQQQVDSFTLAEYEEKEIILLEKLEKNGNKFLNPLVTKLVKKQFEVLMQNSLNLIPAKQENSLLNSKRSNNNLDNIFDD